MSFEISAAYQCDNFVLAAKMGKRAVCPLFDILISWHEFCTFTYAKR